VTRVLPLALLLALAARDAGVSAPAPLYGRDQARAAGIASRDVHDGCDDFDRACMTPPHAGQRRAC
jgi:hypothetical protein